jgi:hypothetical protein
MLAVSPCTVSLDVSRPTKSPAACWPVPNDSLLAVLATLVQAGVPTADPRNQPDSGRWWAELEVDGGQVGATKQSGSERTPSGGLECHAGTAVGTFVV